MFPRGDVYALHCEIGGGQRHLVAGDGYLSYYAYGHDGNRAIKMTGNASIDQSGMLLNSTNLENITIYPNEYLTVTRAEYTKYYYAGGNRIASKIGTGGFEKMTRLCTLDQGPTYNANTLLNFVLYQVTNTTQPPTDEYPVDVCAGYNVSNELLHSPLPDFYISQTNLNFTQNNLLQQFRQNLAGGTEPVYYFHSDHLGSASWITSGTGGAVQHLLYLPFGEHFVNEQSTGYDERFTFTGKERDAETGYYYHGARFNSSDLGWLSVDPMSDKYPSLTPYNYCAWNPIKLVDPEGEKPELFGLLKYQGKAKFGNSHLGETQQIGNFQVTPFYDNNENLLGYNAGRYRSDGRFVNEYQMAPGDLESFSRDNGFFEAVANLVYCNGEPNWSYVAFGNNIVSVDICGTITELGKMWRSALLDPSFYLASALSITVLNNYTPVKQVMRDIKSMEGKMSLNPLGPNQEFNMTITNETQKLNMRIETHPLPQKYGGNRNMPSRHMNVDYYEKQGGQWKKKDKISKHIILE